MGKLRYILFIGLLMLGTTIMAQRVSNVTVAQEGQKLRIQYELSTASPTEVGLYISENHGSTWSKVTQHLTGDMGPSVSGGSKQMVWDVLQARESLVGNAIVFKVKVASEIKSVKIGNQVWMAENLNVAHYRNGDPIPTGLSNAQWESTTQGAYAIYNDDPANEKIYGKLYNWFAVNDSRGLCPAGWHVPSDAEWSTLETYLGGSDAAGGKLKSTSGWSGWKAPNTGATNSSGFNAFPGGYRNFNGKFSYLSNYGCWWSNSESDSNNALNRLLDYFYFNLYSYYNYKQDGFSVRCVKD